MHGYRAKAAFFLLAGVLALGLAALAWTIGAGSSEAQQGAMHNCPQAGKWAISVWDGADGTDTSEALATCGEGAVDFAYYIDPDTQAWLRYFAARTDISNLLTLNNMQGVLAYGAAPPLPERTPVSGEVSITGELVAITAYMTIHQPGSPPDYIPTTTRQRVVYLPAIEDETGKLTVLFWLGMHTHYGYEEGVISATTTIAGYTYTHSGPFEDERIGPGDVWLGRTGKRVRVTGVLEVGAVINPIKADAIHVTSIEELA